MISLPLQHHRRILWIASHVSISGLLYGLDTGSIGPITEMHQFRNSIGQFSPTRQGLYVSSIILSAAFSSLVSGHVADRISRKYGILTGGALIALGTTISAAAPNFYVMLAARLLTGLGTGQSISVATVYLVEISTPEIRGAAACMLQLFVTLGITAGYFIAYWSRNLRTSMAWRVPFIIQAVMSVILSLGMLKLPYSPRWLVHKRRSSQAREVLTYLRSGSDDVDKELLDIEGSETRSRTEGDVSWSEIYQRRYLSRTSLGVAIMVLQQLTGIDALLYFAPLLFRQAGLASNRSSFLASGLTGLVLLTCTMPAQIWVDCWSRKKVLVIGAGAMATCLISVGGIYARFGQFEPSAELTENGKAEARKGDVVLRSRTAKWAVVGLIYLFAGNFSWSWGVVGKIYACEIISTRLRAKVCAVEQLANWLVNFGVALTAPIFLRSSSKGAAYFFYGTCTLAAMLLCYFVPETKGRSLEEIEAGFEKRGRERNPAGESGLESRDDGGEEAISGHLEEQGHGEVVLSAPLAHVSAPGVGSDGGGGMRVPPNLILPQWSPKAARQDTTEAPGDKAGKGGSTPGGAGAVAVVVVVEEIDVRIDAL